MITYLSIFLKNNIKKKKKTEKLTWQFMLYRELK